MFGDRSFNGARRVVDLTGHAGSGPSYEDEMKKGEGFQKGKYTYPRKIWKMVNAIRYDPIQPCVVYRVRIALATMWILVGLAWSVVFE